MDVFVAGTSARTTAAAAGIDRALHDVGAPHRAVDLGTSAFAVWRDDPSSQGLHHVDERFEVLFDGYLHGHGAPSTREHLPELARRVAEEGRVLAGDESGIFSLVVHDRRDGRLLIAADPGALLPVHLATGPDGVVVGSHHHLLAQALDAPPDLAGVAWHVLQKWAPGSRTAYRGIERLHAGELVTVHADGRVERRYPELYFQELVEPSGDVAEALWDALVDTARPHAAGAAPIGTMLSEGFDSRLVAGVLREVGAAQELFTHGTEGTAGLTITRRLADVLGATHHVEPFADGFPADHEALRRQLLLADNLSIAYWGANAEHLRSAGVRAATTGYALDTTIGAHAFVTSGKGRLGGAAERYGVIARQAAGRLSDADLEAMAVAQLDRLRRIDLDALEARIHRFLAPELAQAVTAELGTLADDVDAELERLRATGGDRPSLVLQRWFLEGRVRRFSFGQELTLRSRVPLIVPSYEPRLMRLAASVPPRLRLHHDAYLRLFRRHLRDLARITSGAHGLPATYPRAVLETGRFAAVAREGRLMARYQDTGSIDRGKLRAVLFADETARRASRLPNERLAELGITCLHDEWVERQARKIRSREIRVYLPTLYFPTELAQVFDRR